MTCPGCTGARAFSSPGGRVTILEAGRAPRFPDSPHAEFIDQVEVGRRVASHVRVAFQVNGATSMTDRLNANAVELAGCAVGGAAALQLTLLSELDPTMDR